jgi:hypothetical protein
MSMAGKKKNCGCGCIGQKPTNQKGPKDKKTKKVK